MRAIEITGLNSPHNLDDLEFKVELFFMYNDHLLIIVEEILLHWAGNLLASQQREDICWFRY